jgi:hypothetical protein
MPHHQDPVSQHIVHNFLHITTIVTTMAVPTIMIAVHTMDIGHRNVHVATSDESTSQLVCAHNHDGHRTIYMLHSKDHNNAFHMPVQVESIFGKQAGAASFKSHTCNRFVHHTS